MELAYLWVEDYKNIYRQGFNFSSRFECKFYDEYDEKGNLKDNCKLEIKPKEHIENFFGDNINVTAIVGKNGSGKSSVAECIAFNHFTKLHNDKATLFLYYDKVNDKFFKYFDKIKEVNIKPKNFKVYHLDDKYNDKYNPDELVRKEKDALFKIFYTSGRTWFDPRIERKQENLKNTIYEIDISDYTLFEWYAQKIQDEYSHILTSFRQIWFFSRTQNTLDGLKLFKSKIKFPQDLVKPKSVYMTIDASFVKINYANFIKDKFGDDYTGTLDNLVGLANTPHNQTIQETEYKLKHILLQNLISIMNLEENDIEIDFEDLDISQYREKDTKWYEKKIDEGWNSIKNKPELKDYRLDRLIEILSKKEKFDIEKDFEDIQEILDIYRIFLGYGKIDFLKLRYKPFLSSGGEQLINLISRVYIQIEEKIKKQPNDKFILLVLDEPDIYLHPNWQKQFINIVIDFLEKNYQDIKFHIIFTTHSPFLLSDISKQNIIFLDTYQKKDKEVKNGKQKVGNCKVLSHDEVLSKKQTFGANIHTLLSDSFFMEDGLMGEFAKGQINEIKKFYEEVVEENKKETSNFNLLKIEYEENQTKFEQIQSIIGEAFLKTVIKNYLDEIENILFDDKAKEMAIERIIREYGIEGIEKGLKNVKS